MNWNQNLNLSKPKAASERCYQYLSVIGRQMELVVTSKMKWFQLHFEID